MMIEARLQPVESPSAWRQDSLESKNNWCLTLSAAQRTEVLNAVAQAQRRDCAVTDLQCSDFPLPTLAETLLGLAPRLEGGLGFHMLSNLPVDELDDEQNLLMLWGLGTYVGEAERQDKAGALLHIVTDTGQSVDTTDNVRGFQTNNELEFHTDGADVFALMCVRQGRSGGESRLVSSTAVFNELVTQRPDLAKQLQSPFHFDARAQSPWEAKVQSVPVFNYHQGKMSALYKRRYIDLAQRFDEVPRLSPEQVEALDAVDRIAADPALAMYFQLHPGDLLFANNHSCFHARTEYEDYPDPALRRRMHRLWLTLAQGRSLPDIYANTREWGQTYERRQQHPRA